MEILGAFQKLIDLESFEKLIKSVKAIWTKNAKKKHTIKVSWISNKNISQSAAATAGKGYQEEDDTMGQFNVMDQKKTPKIMMNNRAGVKARVANVISTDSMIIQELTTPSHLTDSHNIELTSSEIRKRHTQIRVNKNLVPYQQQELEIEYLSVSS